MTRSPTIWSRRRVLASGSALLSATALGMSSQAQAEPPPEIRRLRLLHVPAICHAPMYLAEELLHLEGITEVEYVSFGMRYIPDGIAASKVDIGMWNAGELIPHLDTNKPLLLLAGIHGGCFEVFANDRVRTIRDLRGKTVAIMYYGGGDHILLSSMLAYVGIDPREVNWLPGTTSLLDAMEVFASGRADAFVGFAQQPLEMRARKIGHVIVNTTTDRPWSQYYCCMLAANRDFARRYPITTKRALRAILKAADICESDPQRVARFLSDKLYEPRYPLGLELVQSLPYTRWRETNPEDTIRFHALRLHEVGMVKNSPNKLIEQGMDLRFLNELKKELKA